MKTFFFTFHFPENTNIYKTKTFQTKQPNIENKGMCLSSLIERRKLQGIHYSHIVKIGSSAISRKEMGTIDGSYHFCLSFFLSFFLFFEFGDVLFKQSSIQWFPPCELEQISRFLSHYPVALLGLLHFFFYICFIYFFPPF